MAEKKAAPRRNNRSFHSIVWRLFGSVAMCVVLVLVLVLALNTFALKGFYIREKKTGVSDSFRQINAVCTDEEQLLTRLSYLQDNSTVSVVIWEGYQVLYSTQNNDRLMLPLNSQMAAGTYALTVEEGDPLMTGPGVKKSQSAVIRLVGTLSNGWNIYMRTPVAAIEESVAITNRFLLFSGGVALLISLVLVVFIARGYTKPIRELERVAGSVAQLNFSDRYTGGGRDELARLGGSINTMSAALEKTITQLKNANVQLISDIEQKEKQDTARRAFISNVSHELKTPIALISTYAEGLREDIAVGGANRKFYCEVIEDESRKISELLRRMTMLMQLEGGGEQLEIERFNITELLNNLMEKNRIRFEQKQVRLVKPAAEPVYVWADAYFMENVLTNYLSNALNHVTDGGRVEATVTPLPGNRVRIAVFNTGNHIPEEDLPRVWESFYKVDKARTRAYGGTGIGLSVVAAIMKAHRMPYGVRNCTGADGDGVEFYIELEAR